MNIFDSYNVYFILPNLPKTDDLSENGKILNIYLAGNIFCFIFIALFFFCTTFTFCNAFVTAAKNRCFVSGLSLFVVYMLSFL